MGTTTNSSAEDLRQKWRDLRVEIAELPRLEGEIGPREHALRAELEAVESKLGPSAYIDLEFALREEWAKIGNTLEPLRPSQASIKTRKRDRIVTMIVSAVIFFGSCFGALVVSSKAVQNVAAKLILYPLTILLMILAMRALYREWRTKA